MRVLFMGTPEISARCLQVLLSDAGCEVVGVVTREDKPRGRGHILMPTPVKELALAHGIPVCTPATLRDEAFMQTLAGFAPDIIVVVAYGKILPPAVLEYPRYGCVNLHVSLLPKYRGAAPMQRAIMAGERETGVCVMYMEAGLDTGDVLLCEKFPIGPEDDFESVHDRSAALGGPLLVRALRQIADGTAVRHPQDDALATYAPKIEKEDAHLDLRRPAAELDCCIRGLCPIPMACVLHNGHLLKICKATPVYEKTDAAPGTVTAVDGAGDGSFTVACGEGALRVLSVIPEGRGRMSAGDFVRGRRIAPGDLLC